ncbi:hypothetical protein J31TS4_11480 [Paenibacillus sp. J31TS4]|uniref:response regulator n=1 Tax=Paenibacillus sp. J31TS4 TaxID=2807195 RepID=UPI001B2957C6|nr:response regulator [Paenibacillus sp. J31TS4]GIP37868.1 hypothetical protein J31TS4_11480 [Paenibacillus sp. J31TS4]
MFHVLLVDDDVLVRNDLRAMMDWEQLGFKLCGEAYNGVMALAEIEQSPPHIAIIDVNMPEMNGVELNRIIKEKYPSIRTIMLSSYDDYDYVRECLKNDAVDYLLKHRLDEETLCAVLNKAVEDMRRKDKLSKHPSDTEARVNPEMIRDSLVDLIKGVPDAAKVLEGYVREIGFYSGAVCYAAAAVQIVPFLLLTETYSDVQTNRLIQQAVDIIQQSLGDIRERTVVYVEDGRILLVFSFKERSEHIVVSEAERLMSKLQHALEQFLNLKCIYAVGHVCGNLSKLGASYCSAERILGLSASAETSGLPISLDETVPHTASVYPQRISLTIEEQKQLLFSIERLDLDAVYQLIGSVFASFRNQPVYSHSVQMIVSEMLYTGNKALEKWMPAQTAEGMAGMVPSRTELGRIASIGELEQWLKTYYSHLLDSMKRNRAAGPYSRHVSQAIQMILEKYSGHITLELTASAIGLNPSYLSRLFKEETHSTFSEYLNRVRIDSACRLLESGRYSIKQISNQTGIPNYSYFFKVFKEITGQTPQAYLNSLRGITAKHETVRYVE